LIRTAAVECDVSDLKTFEGLDFSAWPRLAALMAQAQNKSGARTGVVYPLSAEALGAACLAHRAGLIHAVLYGPERAIRSLALVHHLPLDGLELVDTVDDPKVCALIAVADCKTGADQLHDAPLAALMKGSLHTDDLLGAVVAKGTGLRTTRRISHVFVFDLPKYHKLLSLADAVVNISPDLKTKQSIVQNAVDALHRIGLSQPKVGVLAAVEGLNPSIQATVDAASLIALAKSGAITGAVIDGAFGFDNAISASAAKIKGIQSEVAGDADLLLAPDLNAGNILYKSFVYMAGAECAGVVLGATVPIVLTSRADSVVSRIASCGLASLLA
jgi:phosphate acetyltransferase